MPNPPALPTIHVAFVEDDPLIAEALATAIRTAEGLQLHGVARSVGEAQTLLALPPAHVLVVDLGLPDGSGVQVIRMAQRLWPDCAVVVSTSFNDQALVMQSLEAGATGYLLKDSAPRHIVDEIRAAQAGGSPISPLIARQLLTRFKQARPPAGPAVEVPAAGQAQLSPRERQVLEYITKGFSYEEIAGLMDVTRNTVLSFVRRIYAKLEVRSQVEAIHEARSQGLLAP
jgi:DNA-binding NarL/FixJ family response regulator